MYQLTLMPASALPIGKESCVFCNAKGLSTVTSFNAKNTKDLFYESDLCRCKKCGEHHLLVHEPVLGFSGPITVNWE